MRERPNINWAFFTNNLDDKAKEFLEANEAAVVYAPGSGGNHQDWLGGYADHLDEVLGFARLYYDAFTYKTDRSLDFTLQEAMQVLFLHDVEKIWKRLPDGFPAEPLYAYKVNEPEELRLQLASDLGWTLNDEQQNALTYIHGEGNDYSKKHRTARPLAAFCHICDYTSARIFPEEPFDSGQPLKVW